MSPEDSDPLIGRVLADKLRLDALLGAGAAGAVYRAHHLALDRPVAIKVLHQSHVYDEQLARRFRAEARAASRLDHPNSVRVLDFGEDGTDRLLYIAMEFLDGESLQDLLNREHQLASWRIASIMAQVAAALAVAHEQGIVHRDVKPGNVMLLRQLGEEGVEQELVKVCDFGLAKILDVNPEEMTGGPLTKAGTIFGTPSYMSPEQANGHAVDGRTDQYACAAMIYRMAAGEPPFVADTPTGVLMQHILEPPVPVLEKAPHLDPRLAAIVDRSLEKDPETRFASMREIVPILREVAAEAPTGSVPVVRMPSRVASAPTPAARPATTPYPQRASSASNPPADDISATLPRQGSSPDGAAPLPTPAYESVAPPPPRSSVLAAVMGSIALLAVGGLGAYVLMGPRGGEPAPKQAAQPAVEAPKPDAATAPSMPTMPAMAEAPDAGAEMAVAPASEPEPEPDAPVEPTAAPEPTKPRPAKTPRRPKPAPPPPPPPPPVVEVAPDAAVAKAPPPPPPVAKPDAGATSPQLLAKWSQKTPPPPPPPAGPKKLGASFSMELAPESIDLSSGAVSKNDVRRSLSRALSKAESCVRDALAAKGVETKGVVHFEGTIVSRGQFRDVTSKGGDSKVRACLQDILSGARMPSPDPGKPRLRTSIRYSAKPN